MRVGEEKWTELLAAVLNSERSWRWDDFLAAGGVSHTEAQCRASRKAGGPKNCAVHDPSNHHMREWPLILRSSTLLERECPHGVGHPDPDSAGYLNWRYHTDSWGVHGCCGSNCCAAPEVVVDYSGDWTVCPGCGSGDPDHVQEIRAQGRCIWEDVDQ